METNTSRAQGNARSQPQKVGAAAPEETQGGVSFETPKPLPENEKTIQQPLLEKVNRELEEAGVTPDTKISSARGAEFSWLADKKSTLASQSAPIVPPQTSPVLKSSPRTPQATVTAPLQSTMQTSHQTGKVATDPVKKKEYSDLVRPLRTYQADIVRAIQKNNVSTSDISVAQQERRLRRMQEERTQLDLKEKLERDRMRLQALQATKRQTEMDAPVPSAEPELDITSEEALLLQDVEAQAIEPELRVEKSETYAVGELAQQAAALAGRPSPIAQRRKAKPVPTPSAAEIEKTIQSAEEQLIRRSDIARESEPVQIGSTPGSSRSMKLALLSVALLILGAGVLGGVLYINRDKPLTLSPLEIDTLVFADQSQDIPVQTVRGDAFMGLLATRMSKAELPLNAISALQLTTLSETGDVVEITTQEWFDHAQTQAPSALVRAFSPKFMLGIHSLEGVEPFLVFKTAFYENAFAGMLAWEKTMSRDLSPLFGTTILSDSGPATSGSPFYDRLINNIDVRILVDLKSEIRLIYGFIDRQTVVISNNRDTFLEVVNRLNSTRAVR